MTVATLDHPPTSEGGEASPWAEADYARRDAVLAGLGITLGRRKAQIARTYFPH
ncbi:MAG TPA: hypothetical protein VGP82_25635 [Ktedonobacterales bacterium]|nr:hypothetical protein [Ktedonobacterales bacterium]